MIKNKNTLALLLLIPSGLLIISNLIILNNGFVTFIKLMICASSSLIIFCSFRSAKCINETLVAFSFILILYNPIISIHLDREFWTTINFLISGVYIYGYFNVLKNSKIPSSKKFEEDKELFELINN